MEAGYLPSERLFYANERQDKRAGYYDEEHWGFCEAC
jgi:hypothetical protein